MEKVCVKTRWPKVKGQSKLILSKLRTALFGKAQSKLPVC